MATTIGGPEQMREEHRRILRPLLEPARKHLADLDQSAVPHKLRPIVRKSGGALPPHLENLLLEALASDAMLRSKVADRWAEGGGDDDAIAAFLANPDDFADLAAELLGADAERRAADRIAELEASLARAEAERDEATRRLSAVRDEARATLADQKAADKRARAGLEARVAAAEGDASSAADSLAMAQERIELLTAGADELREEVERLRERGRRKAGRAPTVRTGGVGIPSDPAALARWLDTAERTFRPYRRGAAVRDVVEGEELGLSVPEGISPDSGEALHAIIRQCPRLVVIDGYNVAGALGMSPLHSSEARNEVLVRAAALRRMADAEVVVVFDAIGVEGRDRFDTDSGVGVRFAQERSADEEIVQIVEDARVGTVVVSNDREVRDHSGAHGAVVLWSDALIRGVNL